MSHYQKLAVVIFRVFGLTLAVSMAIVTTLHVVLYRVNKGDAVGLVSALLYLLLGIFLTLLSKPLSRLAVKGIKEE